MVGPLSAEWVTAIATVFYVIGTFLLWWTTRASLNATRDLFRLNLLIEYYRTTEPAPNVGHPWETRMPAIILQSRRAKEREALKCAFHDLQALVGDDKPEEGA